MFILLREQSLFLALAGGERGAKEDFGYLMVFTGNGGEISHCQQSKKRDGRKMTAKGGGGEQEYYSTFSRHNQNLPTSTPPPPPPPDKKTRLVPEV